MSALEIVPVDPFDRAAFDAWHAVYEAAERSTGEHVGNPWTVEELRVLMQDGGSRSRSAGFSGRVGGEVV